MRLKEELEALVVAAQQKKKEENRKKELQKQLYEVIRPIFDEFVHHLKKVAESGESSTCCSADWREKPTQSGFSVESICECLVEMLQEEGMTITDSSIKLMPGYEGYHGSDKGWNEEYWTINITVSW